jgi:hypothetical protein
MTQENTLFDQTKTNESPQSEVQPFLTELVGEGKKYKTPEDLAKSRIEADKHIARIERENAELRAKVESEENVVAQVDELREELRKLRGNSEAVLQPKARTEQALTAAEISRIVETTVTERERSKTSAENIGRVQSEMIKRYGSFEKAQEALATRAKELGLELDFLADMAGKSPSAFFNAVFGEKSTNKTGSTSSDLTKGSVPRSDISATDTTTQKPGTKAYYEQIRKTDPVRYRSKAVQAEIMKAVTEGTYVLD